MKYFFTWPRETDPDTGQSFQKRAFVETRDCVIVDASPSLEWTIGKDIGSLIYWIEQNKIEWKVTI